MVWGSVWGQRELWTWWLKGKSEMFLRLSRNYV